MKTTILWEGQAYGKFGPKARVLVREAEREGDGNTTLEIITEHCDTDAMGHAFRCRIPIKDESTLGLALGAMLYATGHHDLAHGIISGVVHREAAKRFSLPHEESPEAPPKSQKARDDT